MSVYLYYKRRNQYISLNTQVDTKKHTEKTQNPDDLTKSKSIV